MPDKKVSGKFKVATFACINRKAVKFFVNFSWTFVGQNFLGR